MGDQTQSHSQHLRVDLLNPECYLWCQPGEAQIQPVFDRSSSKLMGSHQRSVHEADSARVWLQPLTPFSSLTWMLGYKWHGLRREKWGKGAASGEVPELGFLESRCVCFLWAADSLITTDVDLAGSCCQGWSEALKQALTSPSSIIDFSSRAGVCYWDWIGGWREKYFLHETSRWNFQALATH